jgi:hypothetical protein
MVVSLDGDKILFGTLIYKLIFQKKNNFTATYHELLNGGLTTIQQVKNVPILCMNRDQKNSFLNLTLHVGLVS